MKQEFHQALYVSTQTLCQIINQVQSIISHKQFIKTSKNKYCSAKAVQYSNQISSQFLSLLPNIINKSQQVQPKPLQWDNLFPTDVDLNNNDHITQRKNKYARNYMTGTQSQAQNTNKSIRHITQKSSSPSINTNKKYKRVMQMEKYEKLNINQRSQQQKIYKELRNQKEDQQKEKRIKQEEQIRKKRERNKEKKNKDQKLGFNYDGAVIKLSQENRKSLVEGGIDGELNNLAQKTKQIKGPGPTAQIQYSRNNKKKLPYAKSQIHFTDIRTLFSDAKAGKGIKLVEGGITMEQKKKIYPVKQLKQLLGKSSHRLSKQEFKRIKQSMGPVAQYQDLSKSIKSSQVNQQKFPNTLTQMRSISESKVSNEMTRRKSTITISDPQLLDNMLYGPVNQAQERRKPQQESIEDEHAALDKIDNYNIQYMKKGGNLQAKQKSKSVADLIKLPKVKQHSYTSQFGVTKQMPRAREKLREGQDMIRSIRRRFEQKLRI